MLKSRIYTSLSLFILTLIILFYSTKFIFALVLWGVMLLALHELLQMYKFTWWQELINIVLISLIFYFLLESNHIKVGIIKMVILTFWGLIVPMILFYQPLKFNKLSINLIAILLFIPAFYAIFELKILLGSYQLLSLLAIAWIADSGAYLVGRKFGRHKFVSTISPGKSIEGVIAGLVLVGLYLYLLYFFTPVKYLLNFYSAFGLAIMFTLVSVFGDLFESWLKRVAKIKDSGKFLPGHGGIFDRIDSTIAIMPIAFIMIKDLI